MIHIDRHSGVSIQTQIADQLRYHIARGHFSVEGELPSTRSLGSELSVSFHTVRSAYRLLEADGLVRAIPGRGFVVQPIASGTDSDRMETGADTIRHAVQRLIGIGLSEQDIEYLFDEQLATIAGERATTKTIFVGAYREQSQECTTQLGRFRFGGVVPTTLADVAHHEDADYAICPFTLHREVRSALHRTEVIGLDLTLNNASLDVAARMLSHETLTLVTRFPDAIGPLTRELRSRTDFPGQLLAGSVDQGTQHMQQIVAQADAILYTSAAKTRVAGLVRDRKSAVVVAQVPDAALVRVQDEIPDAFRF